MLLSSFWLVDTLNKVMEELLVVIYNEEYVIEVHYLGGAVTSTL